MSDFIASLSLSPNGNVNQSSFVRLDPSNDNFCLQAVAGQVPIGIAQAGAAFFPDSDNLNPTYAAVAGGTPPVIYPPGTVCPLKAGGNGWSRGDYLRPNADGYGVPCAPGEIHGAYALTNAAAGDRRDVLVTAPGQQVTNRLIASAVDLSLTPLQARSRVKLTAADVKATLPLLSTVTPGTQYTVVCDANAAAITAGTTGVKVAMNATDRPASTFIGGGVTPTAARDLCNTKATAKQGDFVTLETDGVTWYIVAMQGIWALTA